MKEVKLGEKYTDSIHGLEGVAVSITHYLTGCAQVQLETMKDGEIRTTWFDITRLKDVYVPDEEKKPGGPQAHAPSRHRSQLTKPHNNEQWTVARYNSFIKSALRSASVRWPPKNNVKKAARVERGVYKCAGYKVKAHKVPASLPPQKEGGKRVNNAVVDHIHPVINPKTGFVSWDDTIKRMFCEADGLQVLCHKCHSRKTMDEKEIAKNAKRK